MADKRVVQPTKIVDPTTTSQEAAVTAGGFLRVDVASTVAIDTELPAAAALADNAANPTTPLIGACLLGFDGTTWDRVYTVADGDVVAAATKGFLVLGTDGVNYQVLKVDSTGSVQVDIESSVALDTELPAPAALADATANPTITSVGAFLQGFNGTTWDRVRVANTGRLQVDVVTGGSEPTPTGPTVNLATSAAVAAGSSANLDTAEITAAVKLWQVTITASVAFKVVIQKVENAVATAVDTLFGRSGETIQWRPPHRNFVTHAGASAGLDVFRAVTTNMDTSQAADLYATFFYST